jgi:predicted GTPase
MGYSEEPIKELEETINSTPVDLVLIGTPIDLSRVLKLKVPAIWVRYELLEIGSPGLTDVLSAFTTGETDHGQPNTSETTPREHALASAK